MSAALKAAKARCMDASALPREWSGSSLPSARKSGRKWQAVVFFQRDASDKLRFGWSSSDLYADRDEALEVACLTADRFNVAEYLNEQNLFSLPVNTGPSRG